MEKVTAHRYPIELPRLPVASWESFFLWRASETRKRGCVRQPGPALLSGQCAAGCSDPDQSGCDAGEGNVCNPATGLCECDTNDDCVRHPLDNRRCLDCADSDDCAASAGVHGRDTV